MAGLAAPVPHTMLGAVPHTVAKQPTKHRPRFASPAAMLPRWLPGAAITLLIILAVWKVVPDTAQAHTQPRRDGLAPSHLLNITALVAFIKKQAIKTDAQVPAGQFPHAGACPTCPDWLPAPAKQWISGFYPTLLLRLSEYAGDHGDKVEADQWWARARRRMGSELAAQALDQGTHDVGFKVFYPYGHAYMLRRTAPVLLTPSPAIEGVKDRDTVLLAAKTLGQRFNATVGAIKSWDTEKFSPPARDYPWPVIIDNMMNLELLLWASQNGGKPALAEMAMAHADTSARDLLRADGCAWHLVNYDPATGKPLNYSSVPQGYNLTSTWTRGQGFSIYGYNMVYRYTGQRRFLEAAQRTVDCYMAYLMKCCQDTWVPPFDFDYLGPTPLYDSSAAAIVAAGLLEMAQHTGNQSYHQWAVRMLEGLSRPPFLATGTQSNAVLLHGMGDYGKRNEDVPLIYGDYFFLEALMRLEAVTKAHTTSESSESALTVMDLSLVAAAVGSAAVVLCVLPRWLAAKRRRF